MIPRTDPTPFGLIRYGVAPDHPRIKGIITALRSILGRGDIRFFGNVEYGRDITLGEFLTHYDAVIFATGAVNDAPLDIPGADRKTPTRGWRGSGWTSSSRARSRSSPYGAPRP